MPTTLTTSGRRGRPSAEDSKARQAQLLTTARQIFIRRGYRSTTMEDIAAAAGITKRTLYAWHKDKESLFRECILFGARRFPPLSPDGSADVRTALVDYAIALHNELAKEDSSGLGLLFLREGQDFPELSAYMQQPHYKFLIEPLAEFFECHRLANNQSIARAELFVNMALSPLHNGMMLGKALPDEAEMRRHAELCADLICAERSLRALQSKDSTNSTISNS